MDGLKTMMRTLNFIENAVGSFREDPKQREGWDQVQLFASSSSQGRGTDYRWNELRETNQRAAMMV